MPTSLDRVKEFFTPKPGQSPGLFQASATIISISAIYIYFAGYVYCYAYYFRYYEVPLESLDLSPQFYMMRAFTALDNAMGIALVVLVVVIVVAYLGGKLPTWITAAIMIAAFPALFHISYATASKDARRNICLPNNSIRIHFKDSAKKDSGDEAKSAQDSEQKSGAKPVKAASPDSGNAAVPSLDALLGIETNSSGRKDLIALGEKGQLALLLETKDRIVLIQKPECEFEKDPPSLKTPGHVYSIARSDLDFTNVTLP